MMSTLERREKEISFKEQACRNCKGCRLHRCQAGNSRRNSCCRCESKDSLENPLLGLSIDRVQPAFIVNHNEW